LGAFLVVLLFVSLVGAEKDDLLERVEIVSSGVDMVWIVFAAALVFFMQAGFALLGGALRSKNIVNYMTKSYLDFSIGALVFFFIGFGIMFGGSGVEPGLGAGNNFFGTSGFMLSGNAGSPGTLIFWLFQVMFAATAATIVAGAVAGRMKFRAYWIYTIVITALIYPLYGHWIWGGGFLSKLGAVDFAGSGVVHAVGGILALVGAWMIGPRIGKYSKSGSKNIAGHNVSFVVLGTFILFVGWFGFNAGSTLSATDPRIALIAVNTFLSGAAGGVSVTALQHYRKGRTEIMEICNGALAGLVAITAPCAFVAPVSAIVIGSLGGFLLFFGTRFIDQKLKIDDPLGASSVHGLNGIWGLVALGIFADGSYGGVSGLIAGNMDQFISQIIAAVTVIVWAGACGLVLFYIIKKTVGLRVSREEETIGLDISEHRLIGYPDFTFARKGNVGNII